MNILKVYGKQETLAYDIKHFATENPGAKLLYKDSVVELYNGIKVCFVVVSNRDDAFKRVGSKTFQCLDLHSSANIDLETLNYLKSRIRG